MAHLNVSNSDPKSNVPAGSDHCTIEISKLSNVEWLGNISNHTKQKTTDTNPRIRRVPKWVRDIKGYEECFDPVVVSIGPYHYSNPKFVKIEQFKIESANRFISNCKPPRDISQIYSKVKVVSAEARKCYARDYTANFNDETFARIMFMDGCFVLDFIHCYLKQEQNDHCYWGKEQNELLEWDHTVFFIVRDLFLLENQLPYVVLKELMSFRSPDERKNEGKKLIHKFIDGQIDPDGDYNLPDLLRTPTDDPLSNSTTNEYEPSHLLDLLRTKLIGNRSNPTQQQGDNWRSFPSVVELKARGIKFKKSSTCCLNGIQLKSLGLYAQLSLPHINIDDGTKDMFLNLIAYEMFPDFRSMSTVTSYICFLDKLIDNADDVKELRSKDIIFSGLGSDQEVADLINALAIGLSLNPGIYGKAISGIHSHCKNKVKTNIGEFLHTHFSSPWTTIAFFAATYVTILTTIQTCKELFSHQKT